LGYSELFELTEHDHMKKYLDGLSVLASCAWVGGMWTAGYIAAPVLFQSLPDKVLAGMLAGKLFSVTAWMGMVCAVFLLIYFFATRGRQWLRQGLFWVTGLMLLSTLLGQFGLQPLLAELKAQALPLYVMDSPYADRFRLWHGVSSIVYLIQSLLGAVLLLKIFRNRQ
jgi:uncharacterized membrane protein YeaQ/YmgE (transglycosylase-associated protein family)